MNRFHDFPRALKDTHFIIFFKQTAIKASSPHPQLPLLCLSEYEELHPQDICIKHEEDCARAAESEFGCPGGFTQTPKIGRKQKAEK